MLWIRIRIRIGLAGFGSVLGRRIRSQEHGNWPNFCDFKGTVSRERFGFWFFRSSNVFYNAKSVFLAVTGNASLRWLNNVSGVYLVQVSLLLIGPQGLGHFFRYRPLLPIGWRQCCGFVTFWYGSGSADLCLWPIDPDPAIFVLDLQDANNDKYSTNHSKCNTSSKLIHFNQCTTILHYSANTNLLLLEWICYWLYKFGVTSNQINKKPGARLLRHRSIHYVVKSPIQLLRKSL